MKARVPSWLLFLIFSLSPFSASAELVSGIDFPDTLHLFKRTGVKDFERTEPGLGKSVAYQANDIFATVYIYNRKRDFIPDGVDFSVIPKEFSAAKQEVRDSHPTDYENPIPQEPLEVEKVPFLHASFRYKDATVRNVSHLFLTAKNGNFVKIRITYSVLIYPAHAGPTSTAGFVTAFAKILAKVPSTKRAIGSKRGI